MLNIQFSDFQDVVLSVDNSMTKIVVFACPRLYTILVCLNKLVIQKYPPDGMEKFTFTMR